MSLTGEVGAADAAALAYVQEVVTRLGEELGGALVGVHLVGSAAWKDWIPARSDLDVLVVCADALTPARARAVAGRLWQRALPCPARGLELVVYRRDVLADPGARVPFELNLNTGPGMPDHLGLDPAAESAHWFLLDVAMARERALALVGPPLDELLGPVERAHVLAALALSLDWHARAEPASANAALNACRAWRAAAEGTFGSKTAGARWAVDHGADPEAVHAALAARRGGAAGPTGPQVARLLATARAAVTSAQARAQRRASPP